MAKLRHKKRTHVPESAETKSNVPKSMVIKMGDPRRKPTQALSSLVRDFRQVMQPHTAVKLRERRANKLKDYLVMAGLLGVTNFFIFSQSASGNTTLRIGRTPRGPTLYFRVNQYSLSRDIQKVQARPHALTPQSPELQNPPVLVMNNFSTAKTSDMDALVTSTFQNMLPTIQVDASTSLNGVRRVLLLNRDPETGDIKLRHYAVVTRVVGATRAVKKLDAAARGLRNVPDLQHLKNVAQFMDDANTSDSEAEDEIIPSIGVGAAQGISQPTVNAARAGSSAVKVKRAVKLVEVGPRLNLSLLKIEDGLCSGKTLYHKLVTRSSKEVRELETKHMQKDAERAHRRREQEENVKRKREAGAAKGSRRKRGEERLKQRRLDEEDEMQFSEQEDEADPVDVEDMNDYELEAEMAAGEASGESGESDDV